MIPLIQCERSDAIRYYREVLVFYKDQPHTFIDYQPPTVILATPRGDTISVPYSEIRITVLDPFYAKNGEFFGHQAGRRTSRGINYPRSFYGDIVSLLATGDVPPYSYDNGVRVNKDFRTLVQKGVTTLLYRNDYVGFVHEDVYYVVDSFIQERLLGVNNGLSVQVIPK